MGERTRTAQRTDAKLREDELCMKRVPEVEYIYPRLDARHGGATVCRPPKLECVLLEQLGKLLLERGDFGDVAYLDIGVVRILEGVVLVVVLAGKELDERRDLRNDGAGENVRVAELLH